MQHKDKNDDLDQNVQDQQDPIFLPDEDIELPIETEKLVQMQKRDKFCKNLINQIVAETLKHQSQNKWIKVYCY